MDARDDMPAEFRGFFDREEFYDSWDSYDETFQEIHEGTRRNNCHLPDPHEIQIRIADMKWLQQLGFSDDFVGSVLERETPDISTIRRLLAQRYTPKEIAERFRSFLDG